MKIYPTNKRLKIIIAQNKQTQNYSINYQLSKMEFEGVHHAWLTVIFKYRIGICARLSCLLLDETMGPIKSSSRLIIISCKGRQLSLKCLIVDFEFFWLNNSRIID